MNRKTITSWIVKHPWHTIVLWTVIFIGSLPFMLNLTHQFKTDGLGVPGSPSQHVQDIVQKNFGTLANSTATVVFYSPSRVNQPQYLEAMQRILRAMQKIPAVASVPSVHQLAISPDGHVMYGTIFFNHVTTNSLADTKAVVPLRHLLKKTPSGLQGGLTGLVPLERSFTDQVDKDLKTAEIWSFPLTLIALVWIFRSVIAPIGPLAIGFGGITVGLAGIDLIARVIAIAPEVEDAAAMIGLGVGIDYALLMVHRYRLARKMHPAADAANIAAATAGRAVLFSGSIVAAAFAVVLLVHQPLMRSMALGSLAAVLATVIAALTLLPAILVVLDRWLDWPYRQSMEKPSPWWQSWAKRVMKRPLWGLFTSGTLLLLLAWPVTSMHFWNPGVDTLPASSQTRQTYDLWLKHTFSGVGSPLWVVLEKSSSLYTPSSYKQIQAVRAKILRQSDVHEVLPPLPNLPISAFNAPPPTIFDDALSPSHRIFLFTVFPNSHGESQATQALVRHLRSLSYPFSGTVLIGGGVAYTVDVIALILHWLPIVAVLIAVTTMILLFRLFHSVALAIKAVIMNLLSVSAASGLLVLVFQDGLTRPLTGIAGARAIDWTTPLILFSVLFGLSTDYEVFLLTRIMDYHHEHYPDAEAIAQGLADTGRIITGAALIMVTVFIAFGVIGLEFMQELGIGLGIAILLDATLVRLILVPSIMRLLGSWNWWPGA
ncbi:MMPL family transporter [Sulfobacillus thermosulfidooxidans]|uniref:MMPL family transporter n=1 Tax=Sulfobacillus thermosulfidooxidans TaxID=28034 RepID=UPI0006B5AC42|nr:MMPL family transporter [Sulfobacillus thermosulfidooxidans]